MVINYPRRHQSAYVSFAEYDILDIDKVASGSRTRRNIFHIRMKGTGKELLLNMEEHGRSSRDTPNHIRNL